jgi:CDP-diglyceride synthetase
MVGLVGKLYLKILESRTFFSSFTCSTLSFSLYLSLYWVCFFIIVASERRRNESVSVCVCVIYCEKKQSQIIFYFLLVLFLRIFLVVFGFFIGKRFGGQTVVRA